MHDETEAAALFLEFGKTAARALPAWDEEQEKERQAISQHRAASAFAARQALGWLFSGAAWMRDLWQLIDEPDPQWQHSYVALKPTRAVPGNVYLRLLPDAGGAWLRATTPLSQPVWLSSGIGVQETQERLALALMLGVMSPGTLAEMAAPPVNGRAARGEAHATRA